MIFRPQAKDFKLIGFYSGQIILGLSIWFLIPAIVAFFANERNCLLDFGISFVAAVGLGLLLILLCSLPRRDLTLSWMHGMVAVALSWIIAMLCGALPMWLSGYWNSFLDACFDSMSGFATTGLTIANNIDHMPYSLNLWRHLIMFIGGQGIVIIVLSFISSGGSYSLYLGEAREDRILPNLLQTSRFIWVVSFVYLVLGSLALASAMKIEGLPWIDALFQGVCIFMAGFDTGGFAPQSQNLLYYHSALIDLIAMVIMFLGAISFSLHYVVWSGRRKELIKDIELQSFVLSILILFACVLFGLLRNHTYDSAILLFRKGLFHLISAHTGTGFTTLYSSQFGNLWHPFTILIIIIAMGIGGSIGSTTGAIKIMRLSLVFKSFRSEIKRLMFSDSTVVVERLHHFKEMTLEDSYVKNALMITFAFICLYLFGTLAGVMCGYPVLDSLFESVSASANVGLSMGITSPSMPTLLKITYIFQMWIGRLEFISVFVLVGFIVSWLKGK